MRPSKPIRPQGMVPRGPSPTFYSQLASFPPLPNSQLTRSPEPSQKSPMSKTQTEKTNSQSYALQPAATFKEAVCPNSPITPNKIEHKPKSPKIEKYTFISKTFIPLIAIERTFANLPERDLVRTLLPNSYQQNSYIFGADPLKTRLFYEHILVDSGSLEIEHERNHQGIAYSRFRINHLLDLENWPTRGIHTPIQFKVPFRPTSYNFMDYLEAWNQFMFLRENTHTWFVKYPKLEIVKIPRWFYGWWKLFGATKENLPPERLAEFDQFVQIEKLHSFPENIQICKFYFQKKISFIIGWSFKTQVIDAVRTLTREIRIRGWEPKSSNQESKAADEVASSSSSEKRKLSKAEIKQQIDILYQSLQEVDDEDEDKTRLEFGELPDNSDMEDLHGIAQAYLSESIVPTSP